MYRFEIWDGKSNVSGNSAEKMKKAYGMKASDVAYLVFNGEDLMYFQPTNPFSGELTKDNIKEVAEKHIEKLKKEQIEKEQAEIEEKDRFAKQDETLESLLETQKETKEKMDMLQNMQLATMQAQRESELKGVDK